MRAALLLVWVAGCVVPKGRYELVEVQLDATRTALSARTVQASEDARAYEEQIARQLQEIVLRQLQLDELIARGALGERELDRLQAERVALTTEIAALREEIERLRAANATRPAPDEAPEPEPTLADQALTEIQRAVQEHFHEQLERERVDDANQAVARAMLPLVEAGHAEVFVERDEVIVRLSTARLFQEGWTTLSPRGEQVLEMVATALQQVPGRRVSIEGHTDDRPVHSAEFPSNWERGFSRAIAVLRELEGRAVPARLSATSHAGSRPIADDTTEEGRRQNRRVELVLSVDPTLVEAFGPTPVD